MQPRLALISRVSCLSIRDAVAIDMDHNASWGPHTLSTVMAFYTEASCKHDGLSLELHIKKPEIVEHTYNPSTGDVERG